MSCAPKLCQPSTPVTEARRAYRKTALMKYEALSLRPSQARSALVVLCLFLAPSPRLLLPMCEATFPRKKHHQLTLPTCAALLTKASLSNCQRMVFHASGLVPVHTAGPRKALASTNLFLVRAAPSKKRSRYLKMRALQEYLLQSEAECSRQVRAKVLQSKAASRTKKRT